MKSSLEEPPQLAVKIPKLQDVQVPEKSWEFVQLPTDVLLVTVKDVEFLGCFLYLGNAFRSYHKDLGHVYFGQYGDGLEKVKISLVRCNSGSTQAGASHNVVRNAIECLKPKAVFSVGFCGGLKKEKTQLGDVVISAKLTTYAEKKIVNDRSQWCGNTLNLSKNIMHLVRSAADGWRAPLNDPVARELTVHRDVEILTGPELSNSPRETEWLLKQFPRAIAVETEGEGVYAAAFDRQIEWVIIKGISHYTDDSESGTEEWQSFASVMAVSVVKHILKEPNVLQNWPRFEGTNGSSVKDDSTSIQSLRDPKVDDLEDSNGLAPPIVDEVDFRDMKMNVVDWRDISNERVDVLLLTTSDEEFRAAFKILSNPKMADSGSPLGQVYFGGIGKNKAVLLKTSTGARDVPGTQEMYLDVIKRLHPKSIIGLGSCLGIKKDKHDLGDVLVSSNVVFFGSSGANPDGAINTLGMTAECDRRLVRLFDGGKIGWCGPLQKVLVPKVHVGKIINAPEDIHPNSQHREEPKKRSPEAIGVEIEGIWAICQKSGVPWILCKSITNWVGGSKDSKWHTFCAAASTSYVEHVLTKFYIPGEIQGVQHISPKPFLPFMVPHFTGRDTECEEIVGHMTSKSTRLVTIWGPPGFGKTSVAIAAGHRLKRQGLSVYFFSLRSVKSMNGLTSKLLNCFANASSYASEKRELSTSEAADELWTMFSKISSDVFIVLDNADDLLESGSSDIKQEVCDLFQDILVRCKNVNFLCIARMKFQFLELKFQGDDHKSVKIGPLEGTSSCELVRAFLPTASDSVCLEITRICGCVPLAIKLFCSLIPGAEKPNLFLEDFRSSARKILELLDDPDLSSDLRLKILFESSFKRLSGEDQEAFVSLSVFVGEKFYRDAGVKVIGGEKLSAMKILHRLERKGLIDPTSETRSFSVHPLLRAFAVEKGETIMKQIAFRAKTRFFNYYVMMFKILNEKFLAGNSLPAFVTFYQEKENIFQSLIQGVSNDTVCVEIFDALSSAELFLDTICLYEYGLNFNAVYDSAIKQANERRDVAVYSGLVVSRAFSEITWGTNGSTLELLKEVEDIEVKNPSAIPDDVKGKRMCYYGIYALINKKASKGTEILEKGVSLLSNSCESTVLKVLSFQILALHFKPTNVGKFTTFIQLALEECRQRRDFNFLLLELMEGTSAEATKDLIQQHDFLRLSNQPLILELIFLISQFAENYFLNETIKKLGYILLQMLEEIEAKFICDHTVLPFLRYVIKTLQKVNKYEEAQDSLRRTLDAIIREYGEQHPETAKIYHDLGIAKYQTTDSVTALQFEQKALNIRLNLFGEDHELTADTYYSIGATQYAMEDYVSALQSCQKALNIRLKLFGEEHALTSQSYCSTGMTQLAMKDNTSALQSQEKALKIRMKLFGEEHSLTAESYHFMGVTQFAMKDNTSALQSQEKALKIRLKLFGEEHGQTANSYFEISTIQFAMKDSVSALQSYQKALNISLKLAGEEQAWKPKAYQIIGETQYAMEDYTSALQSHQKALSIRLKSLGEEDELTADSYHCIGKTQCAMKDYISAHQSHLKALNIRLKLFGEKHVSTADSYYSIGATQYGMKDYASAIQSCQTALNIRLQLLNEEHALTADSYYSVGVTQHDMEEYRSARQSLQKALDIRLNLFGEEHAFTAESYSSMGIVQHTMKEYTSAFQSHLKALNIRLKLFGEEHALTADSYQSIAGTQCGNEDYASALQSCQKALNIRLKLFGEEHALTAESYSSMGMIQHAMKEYTLAFQSHLKALNIRLKLFGGEHALTTDSYQSIAGTQFGNEDYASALQSCQKALNIRLKLFGEEHALTAESYSSMGMIQHAMKQYTLAFQSHLKALNIRLKLFGEEHALSADSYHSTGETQHEMEDYVSALYFEQKALKIRLKLFGEEHTLTANSCFAIGTTQLGINDYMSALQFYQKSLSIRLKLFGEEHELTSSSYDAIGMTLYKLQDYKSALQSHQKALIIRLKLFGEEHKLTAESYFGVGRSQNAMKDYASALQSHGKVMNIGLKLFGEEHAVTVHSYREIGIAQYGTKDYLSALQSCQKALDIGLKLMGEEHTLTADSYCSVGMIQLSMKDYTSALQSLKKALNIRLKLSGEEHELTADSYHWIGLIQHVMQDYASALQSSQKALNIRLKLFGEEHPLTADSYRSISVTQHAMADGSFTIPPKSSEHSVEKLLGQEHALTTDRYSDINTQQATKHCTSVLGSNQDRETTDSNSDQSESKKSERHKRFSCLIS